jgi:hypothetical protein
VRRVELYLHLNGLVERRRVEPLQIVEEHRERVFRPREYVDEELAITNSRSNPGSPVSTIRITASVATFTGNAIGNQQRFLRQSDARQADRRQYSRGRFDKAGGRRQAGPKESSLTTRSGTSLVRQPDERYALLGDAASDRRRQPHREQDDGSNPKALFSGANRPASPNHFATAALFRAIGCFFPRE